MRRFWLILILLLFCSLACRAVVDHLGQPTSSPSPTVTSQVFLPSPTTPPDTPVPQAILTATAPGTTTATLPAVQVPASGGFNVRYHPDGPLFVGDQISLEIIPNHEQDMQGQQVEVRLKESGQLLGTAGFGLYGIGRRTQATLLWVWDTASLQPGTYELIFTLQPQGATWTETQTLLPANLAPAAQAVWETVENDCCTVSYIRGTEADRDLEDLLDLLDAQAEDARRLLGTDFETKIPITFLPRVVGHGGFAGQEISVSYLDRDYAGGNTEIVLLHEMVHLLDGRLENRLENKLRLPLLVEGLAVYFKRRPFQARAADGAQRCPVTA